MKSYLGKWIAVYPSNCRLALGRIEFLYVIKETANQVKAKESRGGVTVRTIQKGAILKTVGEDSLSIKRGYAMNINNEYRRKARELFNEYLEKTLSIA